MQIQEENNINDPRKVDTSNLEVGMEVKDYRHMCQLLDEPVLEGDSKEAQMHRWSLNFMWEKKPRKHKMTITKVFKEPLPDIVPDNATFAKMMQIILIRLLGYMPDDTYHFFSTIFWNKTGMVSDQYKEIKSSDDDIESFFGKGKKYPITSPETAKNFFEIADGKLREATRTALRSLDNAGLIHYRQEYCVKKTSWRLLGGFYTATKEEENLILEAEQNALNKMGLTSKYVALRYHTRSYRKYVNDYIHEHNKELYGGSQWITIVYHKPPQSHVNRVTEQIVNDLKKRGYIKDDEFLDNEILLYLAKLALNDMVINNMIQEARKQHQISVDALKEESKANSISIWNHEKNVTRGSSRFVSDCIYLVDTLVKIKDSPRELDYEEVEECDADEYDSDDGFEDLGLI